MHCYFIHLVRRNQFTCHRLLPRSLQKATREDDFESTTLYIWQVDELGEILPPTYFCVELNVCYAAGLMHLRPDLPMSIVIYTTLCLFHLVNYDCDIAFSSIVIYAPCPEMWVHRKCSRCSRRVSDNADLLGVSATQSPS